MEISHNLSVNPQFNGLKISKNTLRVMNARGEYEAFKKVLPDLERKSKNANITVYAVNKYGPFGTETIYGMSIRPLNRLKDNAVTKMLGLSKNKQGDAVIAINGDVATEKTFRALYDSTYYSRNYPSKIKYPD